MTEEELDNPDKINGQSKERISKASGKPVDDVRMLVFMHKQSQVVHKWLNMKYILFLIVFLSFHPFILEMMPEKLFRRTIGK